MGASRSRSNPNLKCQILFIAGRQNSVSVALIFLRLLQQLSSWLDLTLNLNLKAVPASGLWRDVLATGSIVEAWAFDALARMQGSGDRSLLGGSGEKMISPLDCVAKPPNWDMSMLDPVTGWPRTDSGTVL